MASRPRCLVWIVYQHSTRFTGIIWWQAAISRPLCAILFFEGPHLELDNIAFHFSDAGLSLHPVLHRELVIFPSKHLTVSVSCAIMSRPSKRPCLLQPSKISELIVHTDCDKAKVSSNVSSVEGGSESVPGVSQPQPYCQTASCHKSSSSISSSASDEDVDERARWTDSTASDPTMDTPFLPSEQCSTHIHRRAQRKVGQWSVAHKWRLQST